MKKTRYTEEQIVRILREADREPVVDVAKRHGISDVTIYTWRKRFGDMETNDVKRLKELETRKGDINDQGRERLQNQRQGAWVCFAALAMTNVLI